VEAFRKTLKKGRWMRQSKHLSLGKTYFSSEIAEKLDLNDRFKE